MESTFTPAPQTCLTNIAIPGTHNSATSSMRARSAWALGCTESLPHVIRSTFARWAAFMWSRCQTRTVAQQLEDGVRFLDLRVSPCGKDTETLHIVHGLACDSLTSTLEDISCFVRAHPREIVVIKSRVPYECQTRYREQAKAAEACSAAEMQRVLGDRIFTRTNPAADLTFARLWQVNRNVILIGSGCKLIDTWGKTHSDKADAVIANVHGALQQAPPATPGTFHEVGMYLTPEGGRSTVLQTLCSFSSYKLRTMQRALLPRVAPLLQGWAEEGLTPNIVSTDFYDAAKLVDASIGINTSRVHGTNAPADQPKSAQ